MPSIAFDFQSSEKGKAAGTGRFFGTGTKVDGNMEWMFLAGTSKQCRLETQLMCRCRGFAEPGRAPGPHWKAHIADFALLGGRCFAVVLLVTKGGGWLIVRLPRSGLLHRQHRDQRLLSPHVPSHPLHLLCSHRGRGVGCSSHRRGDSMPFSPTKPAGAPSPRCVCSPSGNLGRGCKGSGVISKFLRPARLLNAASPAIFLSMTGFGQFCSM